MTDRPSMGGGAPDGAPPPVLQFQNIVKSFSGHVAVDHASFEVLPGEVHGLVGENGAGKSTLIKVLAGELHADSGQILLDSKPFVSVHPSQATAAGIGFIHQIPALVPSLSVAENVSLGLEFQRGPSRLISWKQHHRHVRGLLAEVGLKHVSPTTSLFQLSVSERQLVALARVLSIDLRIVVFDEVTAPLTETEVERLFRIIGELKSNGVASIYISHRLSEIFELASRVTVMKDARVVGTEATKDLTPATLTRMIIGKDPADRFEQDHIRVSETAVMTFANIVDDLLQDVSFDLHSGEILGIAGLGGAGRTNIAEIAFGARQPLSGSILLDGNPVRLRHPADAVAHGIGMVTEDRQHDGYLPDAPLWQNVTLPWRHAFNRFGFMHRREEESTARQAVDRFDIRTRTIRTALRELSGGNQQKTILAKWLARPLKVLILDEPTHGVDVGAKEEIYRLISEVASQRVSILLISSELSELEGLCHRVLVLSEGQIVDELIGDDISEANMLGRLFVES